MALSIQCKTLMTHFVFYDDTTRIMHEFFGSRVIGEIHYLI